MGVRRNTERGADHMISIPSILLLCIFGLISVLYVVRAVLGGHHPLDAYLYRIWLLFVFITFAHVISFTVGIWILALICYTALREYFSLIDIRLQDRLGILGGYVSIPFTFYYIYSGWYNMFIIAIPVYTFLAIPLLVTLGGKETRGTVFSVGSIVLGLLLCVYCLGHIGYLTLYSAWMAVMLVMCVAVCDVIAYLVHNKIHRPSRSLIARYLLPIMVTVPLALLLACLAEISGLHAVILGLLIPLLVIMGHHTIDYVKADLGVNDDALLPGRGQILDTMKSLFYASPIVFHYFNYFCR
jgi:phosphatidate cytidylyltransferase